ncbi:MAG: sec-independent protein translocase protein TatB [Acidimicrobiaceae bacterium]|nr:sec-independent protein translocase protein TatB [Acidimicrobiaceae bacterium]
MGSLGAPELVIIFIVALIVLGPERLPKMARQAGHAMAELRRMTSGLQDEVQRAMQTGASDPVAPTPAPAATPPPAQSSSGPSATAAVPAVPAEVAPPAD